MVQTSVTIQVDGEIKEAASRIAERFGFDLPSVTCALYERMVRENGIPFSLDGLEPNEGSLEAIREAEQMIRTGLGKSYANAHEFIEAALSEDAAS